MVSSNSIRVILSLGTDGEVTRKLSLGFCLSIAKIMRLSSISPAHWLTPLKKKDIHEWREFLLVIAKISTWRISTGYHIQM